MRKINSMENILKRDNCDNIYKSKGFFKLKVIEHRFQLHFMFKKSITISLRNLVTLKNISKT